MRRLVAVAVAVLACTLAATPALAASIDQTNVNYRSNITSVDPHISGLSLQILDYNDQLVLTNHSGRTVTVLGYGGEPYARILADGTVQVNKASPAYYLNQNFYGNVTVPPTASTTAKPQWVVVQKTGTYQWHDHRIHWMSPITPPQVKDKAKKTLIFDWKVPIQVGPQQGAIAGNLFWVGTGGGGFPTWALISLIIVAILGIGGAVIAQRRRIARDEGGPADGPPSGGKVSEAW